MTAAEDDLNKSLFELTLDDEGEPQVYCGCKGMCKRGCACVKHGSKCGKNCKCKKAKCTNKKEKVCSSLVLKTFITSYSSYVYLKFLQQSPQKW